MHQRIAPNAGSSAIQRDTYRPDIDGLRAIAVLTVVAFHAFPALSPGGFIGVDIFFVISGYLISGHIFAGLESKQFSLPGFYAKRVRRIFPALIAVLVACFVFGWFALLADEYTQLGRNITAGAGFVSNLVTRTQAGYFDSIAITKPLLHLWSLGIEEQFYIVWPLIALGLWKARVNTLFWMFILAAASFALNTYQIQSNPTLAFYSPLPRFWELLAGATLAQIEFERRDHPTALQQNACSLIGLGLIIAGLFLIRESEKFPGWWAVLPVAGTALVIAAGPAATGNRWLGNRTFVAIGLISYPLYLWHWPLLSFARIIEGETPAVEMRVAIVVASFVLAALTYAYIEKPLRFGAGKPLKVAGLVVAMVAIGAAGLWPFYGHGLPQRAGIQHTTKFSSQFEGALWAYSRNDTCMNRYPFKEAEQYDWWFCVMNRDAPPTLMVLGNSFANQLYPGLVSNPEIGKQTILSIGTCPPQAADPTDKRAFGTASCAGPRWYNQQAFINDIIIQSKSVKFAILDGIDPKPTAETIERIRRRVNFLESYGVRVIIFTPHLRLEGDIKRCLPRPFNRVNAEQRCEISAATRQAAISNFAPLVDDIRATNPKVLFFDQNALFCETGACSFISDGMPLIRDEYSHISRYGSERLASIFTKWARTNAPDIINNH